MKLPAAKLLWFDAGVLMSSKVALQSRHVAARGGQE